MLRPKWEQAGQIGKCVISHHIDWPMHDLCDIVATGSTRIDSTTLFLRHYTKSVPTAIVRQLS